MTNRAAAATTLAFALVVGLASAYTAEPTPPSTVAPPTAGPDPHRASAAEPASRSAERTPLGDPLAVPTIPVRAVSDVSRAPGVVPQTSDPVTEPPSVAGSEPGWPWQDLALCESSGNPRAVNPAGYYGLYQFALPTWQSVGGTGNPIDASPAEQLHRARILQARSGWHPWPACAHQLGLLP